MEKKLFERFMKINCKRQIKKSLELKKATERRGDKLYVKEKDYDNLFNCWINKRNHNKNQIYLIMC